MVLPPDVTYGQNKARALGGTVSEYVAQYRKDSKTIRPCVQRKDLDEILRRRTDIELDFSKTAFQSHVHIPIMFVEVYLSSTQKEEPKGLDILAEVSGISRSQLEVAYKAVSDEFGEEVMDIIKDRITYR